MSTATEQEHASALIQTFVAQDRRDRYLALLTSDRGRRKLRAALAHFRDLDASKARLIPSSDHTVEGIVKLLRRKGAPPDCVLLAEDAELDGRRLPLESALDSIIGRGMGAFVSCLPGRLAYYEGEDAGERYLLEAAV